MASSSLDIYRHMPHRSHFAPIPAAFAALLAAAALGGCHLLHLHHDVQTQAPPPKRAPVAQVTPILPVDLKTVQPNEAGNIPILEYHDLVKTDKVTGYQYPARKFRQDMDWLYAHDYRPISLSDLAQGRIDVAAGMTPFVLTFDDALRGQFNYTQDGKIDPDCAVGILEAMHTQHPDWALKGTFFVLTDYDPRMPPPFYQKQYAQGKMEYLVKDGFEIGNHTVHHSMGMRHFPPARVQAEFAGAVAGIHRYLPGYNVDTLALPYGVYPANRKLVISGQSGGVSYHNICAMLAGANPAPSPMSKRFDPYRLPRIIPGSETFALAYWLKFLQTHRAERYVSDGDPNTYTVNAIAKGELNMARLKQGHYHLRTYSGTQVIAGL